MDLIVSTMKSIETAIETPRSVRSGRIFALLESQSLLKRILFFVHIIFIIGIIAAKANATAIIFAYKSLVIIPARYGLM